MSTERTASDEVNAAFARIGDELATIFRALVQKAEPQAAAALTQLCRAGRVRAVLGLGVGEIVFELADDVGQWAPIATLKADALELH